jgi:hypothetical protein
MRRLLRWGSGGGGLIAGLCLLTLAGCAPAVSWRLVAFDAGVAESRAGGRPLFVYFRDWASPRCTRFEDAVLSHPTVVEALRAFICVPLQWNTAVDAPVAETYGVRDVPAFVIFSSRGEVLARGQADVTREQLLQALSAARVAQAAQGRATSAPTGATR